MSAPPLKPLLVLAAAGLLVGFVGARVTAPSPREETAAPAASAQPAAPPERPWLAAWVAAETAAKASGEFPMPEPPAHLEPDSADAQIARLAHASQDAAVERIHTITDDDRERRRLVERHVLEPLLRADPTAALELARTVAGSGSNPAAPHHHYRRSFLFYDVPPGAYPDLAAALLAEPPSPFRSREFPQFIELWGRADPVAAATWIAENLPAGHPDTPALNAVATAALVRPGEVPDDLGEAIAAAPAETRQRLTAQLLDASLDAADPGAHADALVAHLHPADLVDATTAFALSWSHHRPADAAAWTLQLPTPEARDAALDTVAKMWLVHDLDRATAWAAALPPHQSSVVTPVFARYKVPDTAPRAVPVPAPEQ